MPGEPSAHAAGSADGGIAGDTGAGPRAPAQTYVLAGSVLPASEGTVGLVISGGRIEGLLAGGDVPPSGANVLDYRPHR